MAWLVQAQVWKMPLFLVVVVVVAVFGQCLLMREQDVVVVVE